MNNIIKKLAEKAGVTKIQQRSDGMYVVGEPVLEKFAELILTEVTDILSTYRNKSIFLDGFEHNCQHPIVAIKKRFGL